MSPAHAAPISSSAPPTAPTSPPCAASPRSTRRIVPAGDLLVAEADGALVAAHAPATGATIADPFRHTAAVVELLQLRGALLRTS